MQLANIILTGRASSKGSALLAQVASSLSESRQVAANDCCRRRRIDHLCQAFGTEHAESSW